MMNSEQPQHVNENVNVEVLEETSPAPTQEETGIQIEQGNGEILFSQDNAMPIGQHFAPQFNFPPPPFFQYPMPNLGYQPYQMPNLPPYQPTYQQIRPTRREDEKPPHHEFNPNPLGPNTGKMRGAKRKNLNRRFMFNNLQKTILENEFANTNYPTNKRKEELAVDLGVKPNIIYNWFQNRRARKPYKYVLCVECKRKFSHPIEYEQGNGEAAAGDGMPEQTPDPHAQVPADTNAVASVYSQDSHQVGSHQVGVVPEERGHLEYGNQSMEYLPIGAHPQRISAVHHHVEPHPLVHDDPMHIPYRPPSMVGGPIGTITPHHQPLPQPPQHMMPGSPQLLQGGTPHMHMPTTMMQGTGPGGFPPIPRLSSSPSPRQHTVSSRLAQHMMSPMNAGILPSDASSPRMLLPSPKLHSPLGSCRKLISPVCSSPIIKQLGSPQPQVHSVTSFLEQKPARDEVEAKFNQSF